MIKITPTQMACLISQELYLASRTKKIAEAEELNKFVRQAYDYFSEYFEVVGKNQKETDYTDYYIQLLLILMEPRERLLNEPAFEYKKED